MGEKYVGDQNDEMVKDIWTTRKDVTKLFVSCAFLFLIDLNGDGADDDDISFVPMFEKKIYRQNQIKSKSFRSKIDV